MSFALVHSGSYGLGNFFNSATSTTTGHFAVATQSGNLLVCVITLNNQDTNVCLPTISAPSTPGFAWTLAAQLTSDNYFSSPYNNQSAIAVYYIDNAAAMGTGIITSVLGTFSPAPANQNNILSFELSEWSGENIGSVVDAVVTAKGISTVPSAGNIATTLTDLLLVSATSIGGNTEATGYTALNGHHVPPYITDSAGAINQYILNASPGTRNTSFVAVAGVPTYCWACVAVAFKPLVSGPTVTNVSPNNGLIAGGTPVTITGTDFLSGATVSFGGSAATSVVVVSSTSITCVTPSHTAGAVNVSVTDSDGTGTLTNGFTYAQPILQVSPLTLTFSATHFGPYPASQNVTITNGDGGTLNWSISSDQSWLSALPVSGTGNGTVAVSASLTGLAVGTYTGHIIVTAAGATSSPQTVFVTFVVSSNTPCAPVGGNGAYISDLSLFVGPATALYTNPIPSSAIIASESTVEGRNAIVLDFNGGDGLYARDLETIFSWPMSTRTVIYLWQPSLIQMPESIYSRAGDWNDGGYAGDKFVQGCRIEADSFNVAKTFQLQSSDDLSLHPLLEMPATFNKQSIKSFSCSPFLAHSVRVVSSDGVPWRVWHEELVFQPFPSANVQWTTELMSYGPGWQHIRMLNIPYIASAPVTLTLNFDQWSQIVITDQLPATASQLTPTKQKVVVPSNKSKLMGFSLASSAPFRVFKQMLEVEVGIWGRAGSYEGVTPFGGDASDGAKV